MKKFLGLFAFMLTAVSYAVATVVEPGTLVAIDPLLNVFRSDGGVIVAVFPAITTTDIVSEYGAYYVNQGQNMQSLLQKLRQKALTPSFAQLEYTENTLYRKAQSTIGELVQAFQKNFTAKSGLEFKPVQIPLHNLKIDVPLYPDDIKNTWVAFLEGFAADNKMTVQQARAQWPLVRYVIEMEVLPQIQHDLETKCYYKGDAQAPTVNVAGAAVNAMDGIRKRLTNGLTSHGGDGTISELTDWSGVTSSNIFDKAESLVEELDQVLEGEQLIMAMSPSNVRAYLRDKRNTHGNDINYSANKVSIDFYENCQIVGLPSMAGTNDLFITPKKNFKYIRRMQVANTPKVEEHLRQVFLMLDWWEAIGFDLNELVYAYVEPQTSGSGS